MSPLLIKDKQCIEIHPNKPLSHQSICALLTKPTATFGASRHSPNVQLHVTPTMVFIIVVFDHLLHSICSSQNWLQSCPLAWPLAAVIRIVVTSRRAGRSGGGAWREAEPLWLRNQMLRGYPPPRRIVCRLTERTRGHTQENKIHQRMN